MRHIAAMDEAYRMAVRAYVLKCMEATGLTSSELATRSGLVASTLNKFLNNPNVTHTLSMRSLAKLAAFSRVPLPPSLGFEQPPPPPANDAGEVVRVEQQIPAPGGRNLPIMGHARAGTETLFFEHGAAYPMTVRPHFLLAVPDAYAVYVNSDSMEPALRHGELLYVDPSLPPGKGDDVVIQLQNGHGFIKRFVKHDDRELVVEQFNPRKKINYPSQTVRSVHVVTGTSRVRG